MIDPHIQKVIFVDEPFLTALKEGSITNFRAFTQPELDTQIVQLPLNPEQINEMKQVAHLSEVRAGAILVKPDYNDRFMTIESFSDGHAERKYRLWVLLCLALGAKKVSVTNIEGVDVTSDEESSWSANAAAKSKPLGASLDAGVKNASSQQQGEKRNAIMKIAAEASGGEPDLKRALQILQENGLDRDDMFKRLYDMRSFTGNALITHTFSLDTSSDFKRVLDDSLKAKVELMSKVYGGKAEFAKTRKSLEKASTALKLTVMVEF